MLFRSREVGDTCILEPPENHPHVPRVSYIWRDTTEPKYPLNTSDGVFAVSKSGTMFAKGMPDLKPRLIKSIAGVCFWLALLVSLFAWLNQGSGGNQQRFLGLWRFLAGSRQTAVLKLSQLELLQVGDQIFLEGPTGVPAIGRITRVEHSTSQQKELAYTDYAEAEFYGTAPVLTEGSWLSLHQGPDSMAWVVETMLSPQIKGEILQLLRTA